MAETDVKVIEMVTSYNGKDVKVAIKEFKEEEWPDMVKYSFLVHPDNPLTQEDIYFILLRTAFKSMDFEINMRKRLEEIEAQMEAAGETLEELTELGEEVQKQLEKQSE